MPSNAETFAKYPNHCFVETGSFEGDGIQAALDAGFPHVISIELAHKYCDVCRERFRHDPRVQIVHGDSSKVLWGVIKTIGRPITFWLDGHWSRGDTALGEQETPLMLELRAISRHPIKTHTILIDDLRMWSTDNPDIGFGEAELVDALLEINPDYRLSHENGYHLQDVFVDDILVARMADEPRP